MVRKVYTAKNGAQYIKLANKISGINDGFLLCRKQQKKMMEQQKELTKATDDYFKVAKNCHLKTSRNRHHISNMICMGVRHKNGITGNIRRLHGRCWALIKKWVDQENTIT